MPLSKSRRKTSDVQVTADGRIVIPVESGKDHDAVSLSSRMSGVSLADRKVIQLFYRFHLECIR